MGKRRKCDLCDKPATHHSVEIIKGEKIEKHLCDDCASAQGIATGATPVGELLAKFVLGQQAGRKPSGREKDDTLCDNCGLTLSEFREKSLLGCPRCYGAFEPLLEPLIARAQEGASHHVGKAPRRAAQSEQRHELLLRLQKRLTDAVEAEDFELAARLRDEIREQQAPKAEQPKAV